MQRIGGAFVAGAELPFLVVHRVGHQRPAHALANAAANGIQKLADNKQRQTLAVRSDGQNKHQDIGQNADTSTDGNSFLLADFADDFANKGDEQEQADIRKHADDTGNTSVFKIGLEHDLKSSLSAVHTDEQADRGQRGAHCRAVAQEVAGSLQRVELGRVFLQRDLRIHTHDGVADHKLESDETKNAHDERDDENTLTQQIVAGIVNQHRQNNRSRNTADHGTHGTTGGKFRTLDRVRRDQRKHGAVRNVGNGVERIPQDIAGHEQNALYNVGSACPGHEAQSAGHQQADRTGPDVGKEFVALVLTLVRVDHRADHRVVDRIPNLHEQQKGSHQDGIDAHVLRPENGERAFQREAHVTAEVA